MSPKKEKKLTRQDITQMEGEEKLKYEIAEELGLLDKVLDTGWRSLSSKETGRIGGLISKKRKEFEKK
ncbi:small, acid-soluble spore protein, alpha/beta type [Roseburia hominis]